MDRINIDRQAEGYWKALLARGKMVAAAATLMVLPIAADAGTFRCTEISCGTVNTAQLYQRQQAARLRAMQQEQRVCSSLRASGRVALPASCR